MSNCQIWNEALTADLSDDDRQRVLDAVDRGDLARYEPEPNDVEDMTGEDVIEHAHATRDAFLRAQK